MKLLHLFTCSVLFYSSQCHALTAGDPAPHFTTQNHEGKAFDLNSRKGHWTVLYFYPKSGTPGCTKEACGFRDNINKIRALGADVFGISVNTSADQAKFHRDEKLNFTLLADADAKITEAYGTKMESREMSKRWTFIIDPKLIIRDVGKDVDPVLNSKQVIDKLKSF